MSDEIPPIASDYFDKLEESWIQEVCRFRENVRPEAVRKLVQLWGRRHLSTQFGLLDRLAEMFWRQPVRCPFCNSKERRGKT